MGYLLQIEVYMGTTIKKIIMKFVKLSIVAMALGLFVTSCGNNESETKTTDSTATTAAPAPAPAPAPADTAMKAADTMKAAPAADTTKKTEVKTEVKKTK
ncbi:MAG: hypothetical protein JSS82_05570 [Bacteroidetes bacterium]|nr:hypothetical protein [Bacteroidota bacterium]